MAKIILKYGNNILNRSGSYGTGYEGAPTTNFNASGSTASQVNVTVNVPINFYDTSLKSPTSWSWDFGNGNSNGCSTIQNPTGITFSTTGTTSIALTAANIYGNNTNTKNNYINVQSLVFKKLAISLNQNTISTTTPYYSGITWTPSGLTERSWTWNMLPSDVLGGTPTTGCSMALKYTDNTSSNYWVILRTPVYDTSYSTGKVTGNNTGIYPDSIIKYNWVNTTWNPMVKENIRISGLTNSMSYQLNFFGSRESWTATSRYTISGGTSKDGTSVTLNTNDNTQNTASVSGITPSIGIIDVGLDYTNSSGYISVIEITEESG